MLNYIVNLILSLNINKLYITICVTNFFFTKSYKNKMSCQMIYIYKYTNEKYLFWNVTNDITNWYIIVIIVIIEITFFFFWKLIDQKCK